MEDNLCNQRLGSHRALFLTAANLSFNNATHRYTKVSNSSLKGFTRSPAICGRFMSDSFLHKGLFMISQYDFLSMVNNSLQRYFANGFCEDSSDGESFVFSHLGRGSKKLFFLKNKGAILSVQQGKLKDWLENLWGRKFQKTSTLALTLILCRVLPENVCLLHCLTEVSLRKWSWCKASPMSVKSLQDMSLKVQFPRRNIWNTVNAWAESLHMVPRGVFGVCLYIVLKIQRNNWAYHYLHFWEIGPVRDTEVSYWYYCHQSLTAASSFI